MTVETQYAPLINECNCEICRKMCTENRTCWGTPEDMERIIDAGYADQLILDYYVMKDKDIDLLAPGVTILEPDFNVKRNEDITFKPKTYVKCRAPFLPVGRCVFFTGDKCSIHEIKPIEGKVASCKMREDKKLDKKGDNLHKELAMVWDTPTGRKVVRKWKKIVKWDE